MGAFMVLDRYEDFSKEKVIQEIIDHNLQGEELLGFGDGFVKLRMSKLWEAVPLASRR